MLGQAATCVNAAQKLVAIICQLLWLFFEPQTPQSSCVSEELLEFGAAEAHCAASCEAIARQLP